MEEVESDTRGEEEEAVADSGVEGGGGGGGGGRKSKEKERRLVDNYAGISPDAPFSGPSHTL